MRTASELVSQIRYWRSFSCFGFGKNYIETVWGRGYVLREPTEGDTRISA